MLLKSGETYEVPDEFYDLLLQNYDSQLVQQELNAMEMWLYANPAKRKTKVGMKKFINSWLKRTQDTGGVSPYAKQHKQESGVSDDSIRGRSLAASLTDITWLDGAEREMMKQFYLNKNGYYFDGEVKNA